MTSPRKSQLSILFLTVFLYLVGFGVLIPILPVLSREYGASALQVGMLMSVYSLMQFLFAPFWGRLSDRYGRRPILVYCLLGETLSYVLFAWAGSVEGLFVARALAGFFGASLSTASAAISDVTPPNERSKGMALIGAAFGLGFVVGPAIGGSLTLWGQHLFDNQILAMRFASGGIAVLCFATFLFAYWKLQETKTAAAPAAETRHRFERLGRYLRMPVVGPLVGSFFLNSLAMSTMEATLILFAADRFGWGLVEVSFGFAFIGVMSAFNQGFLVRRLLPKVGERVLMRLGLALMAMSFLTVALSWHVWTLALAMVFLSFGHSFSNPSLLGTISLLTPADKQGEAMGTTQGTASLGRIIGPSLGGLMYGSVHMVSPFLVSALFSLISLLAVLRLGAKIPDSAKGTGAA
ncbi:MAG: MFS transporter [Bdellovibrionaceae bacterium]|nr:MFS transporter [Pseudobdellovibrionaceae bacterium]